VWSNYLDAQTPPMSPQLRNIQLPLADFAW